MRQYSSISALFASILALFVLLGSTLLRAEETNLETVEIQTSAGVQKFSVEVMRSPAELEKGLMFRRDMPADRGMLFDFKTEAPVMFWMKNTYIPLDMIFASADGTIINIAENAEPLSETIIPSGGAALGVLEVNAGIAARLGIKKGDKIMASIFKN